MTSLQTLRTYMDPDDFAAVAKDRAPIACRGTFPFNRTRDCTHLFPDAVPCAPEGAGHTPCQPAPKFFRRIDLTHAPSSMELQAAAWAAKEKSQNHGELSARK